jgi:SAM-dependent methyltransferase
VSYDQSASFYDAIYEAKKNYRAEAERIHQLIQQANPGARTLLDVACGTGLHDQYLAEWYELQGLDLSEAQLAIACRRLPHITFHGADMTDFNLGLKFDAVTCLFSAIGYLATIEQLRAAINRMAHHLNPGGVIIVEPWLHPADFRPNHIGLDVVDQQALKVARIGKIWQEGHLTHLEEHHLVGLPDGVEYFVEHHSLAMYTPEEYMNAFERAGLVAVRRDTEGLMGRGLFLGQAQGPGDGLDTRSPFLTGAMNLYDPLPGYSDQNNPDQED